MPTVDQHQLLLSSLQANSEELSRVLDEVSDVWIGVDLVYRFWHYSFK